MGYISTLLSNVRIVPREVSWLQLIYLEVLSHGIPVKPFNK